MQEEQVFYSLNHEMRGDAGHASDALSVSPTDDQSLNAPLFRKRFAEFLMAFCVNEEHIYCNQIRNLKLCSGINLQKKDGRAACGDGLDAIRVFRLDMEHMLMPHWGHHDENSQSKLNNPPASIDDETRSPNNVSRNIGNPTNRTRTATQDDTPTPNSEILIRSFQKFPLMAIELAADVIRKLYVELAGSTELKQFLSLKSLTNFNSELPFNEDPILSMSSKTLGNDIDVSSKSTINFLVNQLPIIQIELISRKRPVRIRDLDASMVETLITTTGIVVQAYKPLHKAVSVRIRCRQCDDEKTIRAPFWKSHVDLPRYCTARSNDATNNAMTGEASRCPNDPYVIISEESQYCDIQTIKIQESPEHVPTGDMPRHMVVNAANALAGLLVPGQRVCIVGVLTNTTLSYKASSGMKNLLNANNVYIHALGMDLLETENFSAAPGFDRTLSLAKDTSSFAIGEQFRALANDPAIHQKIFASIAPSIYGLEEVKESIACLLFGGSRKLLADGTRLRGDINILLLGDPSTAKSQFLKFVEKVAPIAVYTSGKGSSAAGLTAAVIRDANGNYALEGGAMVLADGGVVCIDEFDKMRDDDRVSIHEVMEQQTISIAKAGITTVLSTKCSVLAAANPSFGSYDDTKETIDQHDFESTILSRFDLIWLIRDIKDSQRDKTVARHVLNLHSGHAPATPKDAPLSTEALKKYIQYCRANCSPILSTEAAKKLENFYVQVRDEIRQRGGKLRDRIPITVRQLESLNRIAQSLARMSLSKFVTVQHVNHAIHLFQLSTIETAKTNIEKEGQISNMDQIKLAETAILNRLPVSTRASKATIIKDLVSKGIEARCAIKALTALVQKGILEERGDASIKRSVLSV